MNLTIDLNYKIVKFIPQHKLQSQVKSEEFRTDKQLKNRMIYSYSHNQIITDNRAYNKWQKCNRVKEDMFLDEPQHKGKIYQKEFRPSNQIKLTRQGTFTVMPKVCLIESVRIEEIKTPVKKHLSQLQQLLFSTNTKADQCQHVVQNQLYKGQEYCQAFKQQQFGQLRQINYVEESISKTQNRKDFRFFGITVTSSNYLKQSDSLLKHKNEEDSYVLDSFTKKYGQLNCGNQFTYKQSNHSQNFEQILLYQDLLQQIQAVQNTKTQCDLQKARKFVFEVIKFQDRIIIRHFCWQNNQVKPKLTQSDKILKQIKRRVVSKCLCIFQLYNFFVKLYEIILKDSKKTKAQTILRSFLINQSIIFTTQQLSKTTQILSEMLMQGDIYIIKWFQFQFFQTKNTNQLVIKIETQQNKRKIKTMLQQCELNQSLFRFYRLANLSFSDKQLIRKWIHGLYY